MALAPVLAEARPGGGTSAGSRGSHTYSAPPATNTAPSAAAPMQRSMTEPSRPGVGAPQTAMPQTAARPGMFGGGFMSGLMGGIIGVGIGGLLFGHGMFGGGGFSGAGFLGLLLQVALIGGLVWLVVGFIRRRSAQPAMAGVPAGMAREMNERPAFGGNAGGGAPVAQPVTVTEADFQGFEQTLQGVNAAWSKQDLRGIQALCTPEMVQYFADDLAELASKGLRNETRDVKLEQGDLAEAWAENGRDYATVAMRFSLLDATFRAADNTVVEGSTTQRTQATETWTFVRARGGQWLLSAVQQNG
jgi:predicted lipid-binding transport protein (Tim44 family)